MSEYQYYEFQAVDRLLDAKAQAELRAISSRARITASSFVNSYDWGDLKADPLELLERHFDLHLYLANWGTRQFAMKLPRGILKPRSLKKLGLTDDVALLIDAGEHVILSIARDELHDEDWDDGAGWLAALAPVRADLLTGDRRLFPLLWLLQVEFDIADDNEEAPPPGLGPLSPGLATLADFLCVDPDLLEAAGAAGPTETIVTAKPETVEALIRQMPEAEKIALLMRVHAGDSTVRAELERRSRHQSAEARISTQRSHLTAGALRAAAAEIAEKRARQAAERKAAEQRRREEEAAHERAKRIQALAGRGERVWRDVETLIEQRNPKGYEGATALLADLGELANTNGGQEAFARRLSDLRSRHAGKRTFVARLDGAGLKGRGGPL